MPQINQEKENRPRRTDWFQGLPCFASAPSALSVVQNSSTSFFGGLEPEGADYLFRARIRACGARGGRVQGPAFLRVGTGNVDVEKKEVILLDAKLVLQVSLRAFRAELSNGHGFVAFAAGPFSRVLAVGDVVKVAFSPYDMSSGRMIFEDVL